MTLLPQKRDRPDVDVWLPYVGKQEYEFVYHFKIHLIFPRSKLSKNPLNTFRRDLLFE